MLPGMPDSTPALTLSLHPSIAEISAADWDACAGDDNPFVSHGFLAALEASGSATSRTGWLPQHAALRDASGALLACCPTYAKSHSQGEYVFDYGWADAFERAGGSYYPKLQVCAPFSPVPGPRLLVRPGSGIGPAALGQGLVQACGQLDLSSVHITFCQEAEWAALGEAGWLQRLGTQFHWHNQGYASFDDFLGALASRKVDVRLPLLPRGASYQDAIGEAVERGRRELERRIGGFVVG
jgi:predicted N-acyltransferase